jgi:membrane protease YdiL (CAAX protease family)
MISISIFYHHPIQTLSFFALVMALCSIWVKKTFWIWGSFGIISLASAFVSDLLDPVAFLPLGFFTLLLLGLQSNVKGLSRFLLASTAFLIGGALFFHIMPGFNDQTALPYPLCLNYGKTFVGLALLGWMIPTVPFLKIGKAPLTLAVVGACFLSALFFFLHPALYNFHFSLSFFPWALMTLLFVILPEEALLRGFLQKEITNWIGGGMKAQVSAVAITTCIYPLFHLTWIGDMNLLIPTCISGFVYALLYQMTKTIETPIVSHFQVSCVYFLFFGHLPFFRELPCMSLGL